MSIPLHIQRILKALDRPIGTPFDESTGPIYLIAADTDWLRDHLLTIATASVPSKGPRRKNHYVWVAVDFALRLPDSKHSAKVARHAVASDWHVKPKDIERWELDGREAAQSFLEKHDSKVLQRLVDRNRSLFLRKST